MEEKTCGIVQDLLPSFRDGLTGEDVTRMVQEHLAECPQCQQRYEEQKRQYELAEHEEFSRGESFGEKLKKIRYYIIGILIGLIAPIVLIMIWLAVNSVMTYFELMRYGY